MKKIILLTLVVLATSSSSFAAPKKVKSSGFWTSPATWEANLTPVDGDTIEIPSFATLTVNNDLSLNGVYFNVYGKLVMAGNYKLRLDDVSKIYVFAGGFVSGASSAQQIRIGVSTVFKGTDLIAGPQMADASTGDGFGFFTPLPVKFIGFSVAKQTTGILIQWATSEEVNADRYEIERSADGSNWNTIANVLAAGNTTTVSNYSYTDKNNATKTVYYRIKQVDVDQRFIYTSVKVIKTEARGFEVKVAAINNKVVLQFPEQVKNAVEVRLISLNGQVVSKQTFNQPMGQVIFNTNIKGNYIVSVTNAQDIQVAKQVIL